MATARTLLLISQLEMTDQILDSSHPLMPMTARWTDAALRKLGLWA
jgi:hypothetical protein